MARLMSLHRGRCHWCAREVLPARVMVARGLMTSEGAPWTPTPVGPALATVDHVQPLWQGGTDSVTNIVLCCWGCNQDRNTVALRTPEALALTPDWHEGAVAIVRQVGPVSDETLAQLVSVPLEQLVPALERSGCRRTARGWAWAPVAKTTQPRRRWS